MPTKDSELRTELGRLYGANSISSDNFGRRSALPSEIQFQLAFNEAINRIDYWQELYEQAPKLGH